MKRHRNAAEGSNGIKPAAAAKSSKKKGKKGTISKVEDANSGAESNLVAAAAVAGENLVNIGGCCSEELPLMRGVVDEQMSWGSSWLPVWDVEYVVESYGEMFSDVVWDDDIWNLKSIQKIPNP